MLFQVQIVDRRFTYGHSVEECSFLIDRQDLDPSVLTEVGKPPIGRISALAFKEFAWTMIDADRDAV